MADVQTASPVRSASGSAGARQYSPTPPGSRPGTHHGSRPASREGFSGSRPNSQKGSRPTSNMVSSAGRYRTPIGSRPGSRTGSGSKALQTQIPSPLSDRPESVRSIASRGSFPDHLRPLVKTAVKRWKRFHEQRVMERLKERRDEKKQRIQNAREDKQKLARRVPIDVLARDWLNDYEATVEVRAYLLEKLLPVLIMGVEKLLREVDRRELADKEAPDSNFNPINFLGQYLMRNNPRYSNFPEASPYIRGLQDVTDELKKEVFSFEDNRLARVKAEARRRREERTKDEKMKSLENQRRSATLRDQYKEWILNEEGRLELHLVQEALRSFSEITDSYPEELRRASQFSHELEATDDTCKTISIQEFSDYIKMFITDMPSEVFVEFLKHLSKCAQAYHDAASREARREILEQLFVSCDHSGVGVLDRHRVLALFESFWDSSAGVIKRNLRNPRKWPVVELDEVADEEDSTIYSESGSRSSPLEELELVEGEESEKEARTAADEEKDTDTVAETTDETDREEKASQAGEGDVQTEEGKVDKEEAIPETEEKDESGEETKDEVVAEEAKTEDEKQAEGEEKTEDAKPAEEVEKPIEEEKAAEDEKPAEDEKAAVEEKPAEVEKPADGEKPAEGEKPVDEEKPADEDKPADEEKLAVEENATEEVTTEEAVKDDEKAGETAEEPKPEETEAAEEKKAEVVEEATEETKDEGKTDEEQTAESEAKQEEGTKAEEEQKTEEKTEEGGEEKAVAETQEKEKDDEFKEEQTPLPASKVGEDEDVPPEDGEDQTQQSLAGRASVTFAEEALLIKEKTRSDLKSPTTRSGSVAASAFDENFVNLSQFVQLTESFLGDEPPQDTFSILLDFIKAGYVETEEEKMTRLKKARKEAMSARRKILLDQLFERWDNDGSSFLELEEILTVLGKFKENMERDAIEKAKKVLSKDDKLSKREFRKFIEALCRALPGGEDNFEPVIDFLSTSVERTHAERIRGQARKKWLAQIIIAAETSGASMEPVYKAVFQALYKDAEAHGGNKRISANISMLERNDGNPSRGDTVLRYSATTPDDAGLMLGKALFKDMKGISFSSVESGKPIHVPRVKNHGNIHFWNPDRAEEFKRGILDETSDDTERDGSFIVVPLKDQEKRVFGLLGIDTLADPHTKSIFITHEISFFQGVGKSFATAFHYVDIRRKTLRIAESALSWIHRRSPSVYEINVYIVEPDEKQQDYVLRKMITTNKTGQTTLHNKPMKLERKDNLFRDYLFKCVDNSETVTADAYGERHTAFPLRDGSGHAVAVVDISIGQLKQLPSHENKEVQRMLKLLQLAYKEVAQESAGADKTYVLEAEKKNDEDRINVLFDRIMLTDLRENVAKLDARAFAELKSYKDPPKIIHDILISVLSVFYPEKAMEGEFDAWSSCKQYVNSELTRRIMEFDPTASTVIRPSRSVYSKLTNVPHGAVAKHGSYPAQHLYNWAFVCLSLLEHSAKTKESQKPRAMTPTKSALSDHPEDVL